MISQRTLQKLVMLAKAAHHQRLNPKEYAIKAAILVASESAFDYDNQAGNAAAFVAATSFIELSGLSTQVLATAIGNQKLMSHHFSTNQKRTELKPAAFIDLSRTIQSLSMIDDAKNLYNQSFDLLHGEKQRQALQAASTYFIYGFSTAYNAYLYGIAIAARYHPDQQHHAFCDAVTSELTKSFSCEPLEPSLFLKMMTSELTLKIASILLLASLVTLMLGTAGLMSPAFGASIASTVGVSDVCITGAGAALFATSATLFGARYLAQRRFDKDNDKSRQAVDSAVQYDGKFQLATDDIRLN